MIDENNTVHETETPETPEVEKPEVTVEPVVAEEPKTASEDTPQAPEEKVNEKDVRAAAIDEMEKASQKALDAMRENGNEKNEEVVDEAQAELDSIFADFKKWLNDNAQPDHVKEEMKNVGDKVASLLEKTRETVITVSNSEQFKKTMESGREFILGTGAMIADGLQYGYDKLMEIPQFKSAADFVDGRVTELRHSEKLKNLVNKSEERLNNLNNAIFSGLKSFFEPEEKKKEEPEEDLPDLPEE